MKTIIVPTDFSASAEHASLYAAHLAQELNAGLLLLHVYQVPIPMGDFPVLIISADELKKNADEALKRAKEAVQIKFPALQIEAESRMGDVVDEIHETCDKIDVLFLVTCAKDLGGFERFLLGNTAFSIIKNSTFPVIAVHDGAKLQVPKKIALATDLMHTEKMPVQTIIQIVASLRAELHIVHVETEGENASADSLPEELKTATYHCLKEQDVTTAVQHFVEQNNIDLVLILPHKHNLYERLFFKGHTEGLINKMPVPVMCLQN